MSREISIVIPTVGASPLLDSVVARLRRSGGLDLEIVLVHSGHQPLPAAAVVLSDRVLSTPDRLGFAAAVNRGLEVTSRPWVGILNDDALPDPAWLPTVFDLAQATERCAAVQGTNTTGDDPPLIDGRGIRWNSWYQAVQIDRGAPLTGEHDSARPFGASATAVLYYREALDAIRLPKSGLVFDALLDTYYEDVDLAGRLRAAGWRTAIAAEALCRHVGGGSAHVLRADRLALLYGNRHLVLARLLGPDYGRIRSRARRRDLLDALRRPIVLPGVVAGRRRAERLMPFYRSERPLIALEQLRDEPS